MKLFKHYFISQDKTFITKYIFISLLITTKIAFTCLGKLFLLGNMLYLYGKRFLLIGELSFLKKSFITGENYLYYLGKFFIIHKKQYLRKSFLPSSTTIFYPL